MRQYKKHIVFALLLCLCATWSILSDKSPSGFIDLSRYNLIIPQDRLNEADSITYFDVLNAQPQAHASAIVNVSQVSDADFMLLYFAGSREGARDVGIYQSFFYMDKNDSSIESRKNADSQSLSIPHTENTDSVAASWHLDSKSVGHWSEPQLLLSAPMLSNLSGKFIKKLGNPVSFVDTQGRVHLFVVGVSMGGWATSKIYWLQLESTPYNGVDSHIKISQSKALHDVDSKTHIDLNLHSQKASQHNNLRHLRYIKELHLSPFLNFSHLVRTPPMLKSDGGFILPIYHELLSKYPLLLDFSSALTLQSSMRPTYLQSQLQPSFVPLDLHSSVGVYRNHKAYENTLFVSECGVKCAEAKPSNLKNYDSSSVLFNALDSVFLLHNQPNVQGGNNRAELWLYELKKESLLDAKIIFVPVLLLDTLPQNEVSYPSVAINDEFVHIAYTYGRKHIRSALLPKSVLKTLSFQSALEQWDMDKIHKMRVNRKIQENLYRIDNMQNEIQRELYRAKEYLLEMQDGKIHTDNTSGADELNELNIDSKSHTGFETSFLHDTSFVCRSCA
ncbi:sialidase family protein [Helicobacter typhlonius]|uniref:sialidase family protein n=1 Tax=Helicobacter typhlonius TaxID=76936 RepID=UPI002FE3A5F2